MIASLPISHDAPTALIVDDVPQNIEVLGIMLREHGTKVIGATSARQALDILETALPDVILLDIQMPEMDGFTACELIKANPRTQHLPVIFLTARTETADIVKGFSLGAVDFVNKPFQAAELLARVKAHIELKRLRDAVVSQNAELQSANERLRQLDQEKTEFLGIVAHDLRNPLSGIILAADILESMHDTMSADQQLKKVQTIRTSSLYMREIITHLLDINVLEAGQMRISPMLYDLRLKLELIVQNYQDHAAEKGIQIVLQSSTEPISVYADAIKTDEVVENLLSNAVKYSPANTRVWVSLEKSLNAQGAPTGAIIAVRDEGPGLTDDDKRRLFGKFARLSARPTGGENSTGLGLSIVKKLTEAMNGRVWCESEFGKGATFFVELPAAAPA